MIPLFQSNPNIKTGDCLSACVASILEINPLSVPNFNLFYKEVSDFWKEWDAWLQTMHRKCFYFWNGHVSLPNYSILCYKAGIDPHTGLWIGHAIVAYDGQPIHCPTYGNDLDDLWWANPERVYLTIAIKDNNKSQLDKPN